MLQHIISKRSDDANDLSPEEIARLGKEFMQAVMEGEQPDAGDNNAPAEPDTRESLIADILGGWAGHKALNGGEQTELSESIEAELLEAGFSGMITDKRGAKRYYENGRQVKGPGQASATPKPKAAPSASFVGGPKEAAKPKVPTKRAASQAEAHAKIKTILAGNVTPEAHAELLGHLSTLTIPQLKALRDEHGLKASGKLKAELVKSIGANFKQQMLTTGSVDVPKLEDALKPYHDVELNQNDVNFAKANYESLKAQYGTLAIHRIDEIAKENLSSLEDLPKGAKESRQGHEKKLAEAAWMLSKAKKDGITGEVEDASMKDFGANLARIQTAERLKGVPWSNFLLRAVREKFDVQPETSDQQIFENLKDVTGSKYTGERMDAALKMLRADYGTMTQPQLRKILPLLKKPQDSITPEIAGKVAGTQAAAPVAKPAQVAPQPAATASPTPEAPKAAAPAEVASTTKASPEASNAAKALDAGPFSTMGDFRKALSNLSDAEFEKLIFHLDDAKKISLRGDAHPDSPQFKKVGGIKTSQGSFAFVSSGGATASDIQDAIAAVKPDVKGEQRKTKPAAKAKPAAKKPVAAKR